jgi:transcriptional regulator with XRE-family HTH domain
MDSMAMGELIKKRRDYLRLRQEDLSELSGINMRTIHLVEQGRGNPSLGTLRKLSEILGLEIILEVKQAK